MEERVERFEVQEYLDFANCIVPGSTDIISDLKSGEVWCELINLIEEGTISSDKIKKGRDLSEKDAKKNYKALKKALTKKDVEYPKALDDHLEDIIYGNEKINYEMAKWFKEHFEEASHEDVQEKVKKDIEDLVKDRDENYQNAAILFVPDDDEGKFAVDAEEKFDVVPEDDDQVVEEVEPDDQDEQIVAGGQAGVNAATDESGGEEMPDDVDEVPTEIHAYEEDEALEELPAGDEDPEDGITLEVTAEDPVVFGSGSAEEAMDAEDLVTFEAEEEIDLTNLTKDVFSKKGLKRIALMVGCGAVIVCIVGLACYYRTRCGSLKAKSTGGSLKLKSSVAKIKSPGGGVEIKSDTDISAKTGSAESSKEQKARDDAFEKMMKKLWDWFQENPAHKGYIILEKR